MKPLNMPHEVSELFDLLTENEDEKFYFTKIKKNICMLGLILDQIVRFGKEGAYNKLENAESVIDNVVRLLKEAKKFKSKLDKLLKEWFEHMSIEFALEGLPIDNKKRTYYEKHYTLEDWGKIFSCPIGDEQLKELSYLMIQMTLVVNSEALQKELPELLQCSLSLIENIISKIS